MRIHVGILGNDLGWKALLEQEGVSHSVINNREFIEQCSAVIVSETSDRNDIAPVRQYLQNGGAILCSGKTFSLITSFPSTRTYVKYLSPESASVFSGCGIIDLCTECRIPGIANVLRTPNDRPAMFLGPYGGGLIAALPFDAGEMMFDDRVESKSFLAERSRLPHERVSLIAKGSIRKIVARALELLHHRRGLPYVHVWYYPSNAQSIFSLRIDTDFADENEIERLYSVSEKTDAPFSWFVHVKRQQAMLGKFKAMKGHEIGIHCYEHVRYDREETAVRDIHKALHEFEAAGIQARSLSTPYGMWNHDIARAIDTFHVEYSSEFSYDYDNLPSHPVIHQYVGTTLQVPIHPISIGSLRRQGFSDIEMQSYFSEVMDRKLLEREPLIFYHHPKNNHEHVLERMIEHIQKNHIPVVRMIDYALWWKKRNALSFSSDMHEMKINIDVKGASDDVWLHITKQDGTECFHPVQSAIDMQSVEWKSKPQPFQLPKDFRRARTYNPWMYVNRLEDSLHRIFFPKL